MFGGSSTASRNSGTEILDRWYVFSSILARERSACPRCSDYSPFVFPAPLNPKRHWTVYQDAWERAVKKARLEGRRVYDLRSTFATRALEQYPHNIAVANLLGHKTPVILGTYAKTPDGSAPVIVEGLNDARAKRKNVPLVN